MTLSVDAWLLREVARTNALTAQLQQKLLKDADPILAAEWRGQEIAFNRMVSAADRKEITNAS